MTSGQTDVVVHCWMIACDTNDFWLTVLPKKILTVNK